MKNIDQIIKKSLENHELPYNEAAWESMSKRLDGTTPSPFYRKWWVAASIGTILVGSAIFFSLNSKSESSKAIEPNTQIANESNTTVQTNKPTENRLNSNDTPQTNTLSEQQNASNSTEKVEESTNPHRISNEIPELTASNNSNPPIINAQKSENGNHGTPSEPKTYLPVLISQTNLCIGDEIEITNPNDGLSISVVQNNRTQIIKAGSKKVITATNEGAIEVVSGKTVQTITVNKPNDKLYISADPTILYDNGIPSIEFNVAGNESGVQWSVEKYHGEIRNGNFIVHPYTGKDITVKVTSKDLNGCTVSETKNITLKEEYNLQAVNTFNINSNDPRNTRFMPYALIERNVAFELFIYDAKSGRVIYKTNDTSSGWDGTDMNTGSVVQLNSIYGWKVIMKNPLPGEPKEYKGTILVNN